MVTRVPVVLRAYGMLAPEIMGRINRTYVRKKEEGKEVGEGVRKLFVLLHCFQDLGGRQAGHP